MQTVVSEAPIESWNQGWQGLDELALIVLRGAPVTPDALSHL